MKRFFALILSTIFLGGCVLKTNELDELAFIRTIGLDAQYTLTACEMREDEELHVISAKSDSLPGVFTELNSASSRTPYYSHADLAIFGADFKEQNILESMQKLSELRRGICVAILDTPASEALSSDNSEQTKTLLTLITHATNTTGAVLTTADLFLSASKSGSKLAFMPYVTFEDSFAVEGIAVFSEGNFVSVLQGDEALGLKILLQSQNPISLDNAEITDFKVIINSVEFSDSLEVYVQPDSATSINIHFNYIEHIEVDGAALEEDVQEFVISALHALGENEETARVFADSELFKVTANGTQLSQ